MKVSLGVVECFVGMSTKFDVRINLVVLTLSAVAGISPRPAANGFLHPI